MVTSADGKALSDCRMLNSNFYSGAPGLNKLKIQMYEFSKRIVWII
jgi:hypothetical protein